MARQHFPEPTVGALIFNPEGKVFLMRSPKWHNKYVVPGGHVELGEKVEEALKREVKEETGLDVYEIKFLNFQDVIFDKLFWKKRHFIFLDFACKTKTVNVVLNAEGSEYDWFSLKEALRLPLNPYTRVAIKEYLKKAISD